MSTLRLQVVAEARAWLGTPYHAHARVKGHGVDCVHMLCAVYEACGLVPPIEPGSYSVAWHLHQREELYMAALDARASRTEHPQPGDIALLRFGQTFSHAGIVSERGTLLHAYNRRGNGVVMETPLAEPNLARRRTIFYDLYSLRAHHGWHDNDQHQ